jgi:hypothetical protein
MLKLFLTVDYEIFGDGGGCVRKCLIDPTEKLLNICESVGARLTLFVDYCEYRAFREAEVAGILPDGFLPATWIETQLKNAIGRGHDVQLHMHPQWIDYEFVSPEKWKVNLAYWRLPNVPGGYGHEQDPQSLVGLFAAGRKTFENLFKPVNPDYTCRAFRAGARCIQPEAEVLRAMQATGMRFDTTVAPGIRKNDGLTVFDFTGTEALMPCWKIESRLDQHSARGSLAEIPTYTASIGLFYRFIFHVSRWNAANPVGCHYRKHSIKLNKTPGQQPVSIWDGIRPKVQIFDICQQSALKMKYFIQRAQRQYENFSADNATFPLVAAGHPKTLSNSDHLGKFLNWMKNQRSIGLDLLSEKSIWWLNPDDVVDEVTRSG